MTALEREGIADADAVVRRDVLGDRPAIATRLLARDVLAAIATLRNPSASDLAAAVAGVFATSPKRGGLPGWELRERDAPGGRDRPIRLTADDLRTPPRGTSRADHSAARAPGLEHGQRPRRLGRRSLDRPHAQRHPLRRGP